MAVGTDQQAGEDVLENPPTPARADVTDESTLQIQITLPALHSCQGISLHEMPTHRTIATLSSADVQSCSDASTSGADIPLHRSRSQCLPSQPLQQVQDPAGIMRQQNSAILPFLVAPPPPGPCTVDDESKVRDAGHETTDAEQIAHVLYSYTYLSNLQQPVLQSFGDRPLTTNTSRLQYEVGEMQAMSKVDRLIMGAPDDDNMVLYINYMREPSLTIMCRRGGTVQS